MAEKYRWDSAAANVWKYAQAPSRPHKSDINFIEKSLKNMDKGGNLKVLILGSTPEFREICIKNNLAPAIVDYSRLNFEHLKIHMGIKGKEFLINQDWRTMGISEKFDLILGDLSLNMVNFREQGTIMGKLSKLLLPGGLIAHRTWIYKKSKYKNLRELVKNHRNRKNISIYQSLLMELIHFWYDKKNRCIRYGNTREEWKAAFEKGWITKKEFGSYFRVYGYFNLPTYLTTKRLFEKMIQKHFTIKNIFFGRYFNSRYSPIYVLESK